MLMNRLNRSVTLPGVLLVAVLLSLVVHQAIGQRSAALESTTVVTVDLRRVIEGLDQRAAAEANLQAMGQEILDEDDRRKTELEQLRAELQQSPESDEAARLAMRDELALREFEYQYWRQFAFEQLDIEKSLLLRDLDRSVKDAIKALADANGYDIVLTTDANDELMVSADARASREAQVRQQMISRRVLYANDMVDITDELIERMNNAFNAGQ
jgi:Skp family chaperone for outer membrane proteins